MFVITADQVDSRHQTDLAAETMAEVTTLIGPGLVLPVDRTAGDEIQMVIETAPDAVAIILALTRHAQWSVGCGVGAVNHPLPANAREAGGDAFIAAREAVTAAKRRETRFALRGELRSSPQATDIQATDIQATDVQATDVKDTEALINLLLHLRAGRSREGWQIYDLLVIGMTQAAAAAELGITPQAASKRTQVAGIRLEFAAVSALENKLAASEHKTRLATERATNS